MTRRVTLPILALLFLGNASDMTAAAQQAERPRARDIGVVVGVFPTGRYNAITDVDGVRVGHATVIEGDSIHTGVTAIIPHGGDLYRNPVPGWIHVHNGYGKLIGETQVREFGEIETPILLTCTLCVWSAAQAMVDYLLEQHGDWQHTVNPIVGECNDGYLSDMWADPVRPEHVRHALLTASDGPVEEGSVGAGTGTAAFMWKGGIGTSSRVLPERLGGYTVGVLVQTNFGGFLTINGAPLGRELGNYPFWWALEPRDDEPGGSQDGGSIMMVVATDAPLSPMNLDRLSKRAIMGLARTGSYASNSSGDYVIAFSTAESVRRDREARQPLTTEWLPNPEMSPLFAATVEATQEAIYNAMFKATTVSGRGHTLEALPIDRTLALLRKYNALNWGTELPPRGR
jgi:D-aminopeptidase